MRTVYCCHDVLEITISKLKIASLRMRLYISNFRFRFFTDGCRRDDGSFVEGGKTWALPNCQLGICAKSLANGWTVATEV